MSIQLDQIAEDVSKSKYSSLSGNLSNQDISAVWDAVAAYIEKQLLSRKGVSIKNLGSFTLSITRLDIGNNQFIQATRPVFIPSAQFTQKLGLSSNQSIPPNDASISPLNFSALAFETPYGRDIVERCIHEVIVLLENNVRSGKMVDFLFKGIGRLLIGDGRVKMRFFKEFMNQFDKSGHLVKALRNRPGTVDSVMSDSAGLVRPYSQAQSAIGYKENGQHQELQPIPEMEAPDGLPEPLLPPQQNQNRQDGCACSCHEHDLIDHIGAAEEAAHDLTHGDSNDNSEIDINAIKAQAAEDIRRRQNMAALDLDYPSGGSVPTAGMVDFSAIRERVSHTARHRPLSAQPFCSTCARGDCSEGRRQLPSFERSATFADVPRALPPISRPESCCHSYGGQELCYICYQRSRLNQPLDLKPLRQQRDVEEDRMWGEQNKLEALKFKQEQEEKAARQQAEAEKTAAFNLGISEAVRAAKQVHKQPDYCPTFILPKRTLTPLRDREVVQLKDDCKRQADEKRREENRKKQEELVAGQIELLELSKTLSEERERQERLRQKQLAEYRNALDEQLRNRDSPIPSRQPDSDIPVFGALDGANAPERRRNAEDIAQELLDTVAAKRRAEVLRRIQQQREEQMALKRACTDLNAERGEQFRRAYEARRCLENEWLEATRQKKEREKAQRMRFSTPGLLVHEQCDGYKRCGQCQRRCSNNGKSKGLTFGSDLLRPRANI